MHKNILFAGGGTGGHIYPNIAVIQELHKQQPDTNIYYTVSPQSREQELISEYSYITPVIIPRLGGMPRSPKAILWVFKLLYISLVALYKISKLNINLCFSTGGFASSGGIIACKLLRIKYIIHNLDAHLGLSNQVLLRGSSVLTLGIPLTHEIKYKNPVVLTGNPVRHEFSREYTQEDKNNIYQQYNLSSDKYTVLITGGSQGSLKVNNILLQCLEKLTQENIQIIHQIGKQSYTILSQEIEQAQEKYSTSYYPCEYINNMPEAFAISDLIIGRSGAMTISEILAQRKPSILIPLPHLAQNHQYHNAQSIASQGLAVLLEQDELFKTPELLIQNILNIKNKNIILENNSQQDNSTEVILKVINSI